jgi:ketosteroid isomerase-like protein
MKNKYLLINLFCLFIVMGVSTQTLLAQNSVAEKQVTAAVEQLRKVMINADSVTLDKLTVSELSYGHSGGQLQNKQEFIHSFTSGASVFITIEFANQTIKVVNNTAIVRHILIASTNDKGKGPGTIKLGILLVWVKNNSGEWRLLARQAVKI